MRRHNGFTLVELLVVITIIGILVSLAVPNYNKVRAKARDQQAIAGGNAIQVALETYAQSNNGLYPGVADPKCDDTPGNRVFELSQNQSGPELYMMRALIGGGPVEPQSTNVQYFDAFYFEPSTVGPNPQALPDALIASGVMDSYPENPFIRNIPGVSERGRPMANVFGMEVKDLNFSLNGDQAWDLTVRGNGCLNVLNNVLNLSWPVMDIPQLVDAGGDYRFADGTADSYPVTGPMPTMGFLIDPANLRFDRNNDFALTKSEIATSFPFPEGDFAYIPIDPLQRNATKADFMRSCKNYWLVIYGSKDSAVNGKYENVMPNFKPPLGDGRANTSLNDMTAYEIAAKRALIGAVKVYATAYEDQLLVSSDQ